MEYQVAPMIRERKFVKTDKPALPFEATLPGNGFEVPLSDYSMPAVRAYAAHAGRELGRIFSLEREPGLTRVVCVGYCDPRPRKRRVLADKAPEPAQEPAAPAPAVELPKLPDGATGWGDAPKAAPKAAPDFAAPQQAIAEIDANGNNWNFAK